METTTETIEEKVQRMTRKIKTLSYADEMKTSREIQLAQGFLSSAWVARQAPYHAHKVMVGKECYIAIDAKYLNRHTHQSGRGNLRYLYKGNIFTALAKEEDTGGYKLLYVA